MNSSMISMCRLLFLFFVVAVTAGNTAFAQTVDKPSEIDLNRPLARGVGGSSIKETVDLFVELNKLPVGLVLSERPGPADGRAEVRAGTVREMLDSIVASYPEYRWSIVDGVVNIVPVQASDTVLEAILDAPVLEFSEKRNLVRKDLLGRIDNETLRSTGLRNSTQIAVIMGVWKYDSDAYELCGCTTPSLRSTLNSIIKQSNRYRIWIISKDEDGVLLDF